MAFPAGIGLVALIILVLNPGCKKRLPENDQPPTRFIELKVDPSFRFENFKQVVATISVPNLKQSGTNIVQIYNGNPASGGRLIISGSLNNNNQFQPSIRIPSRLTEVYVGKLASDGNNEYVAAPIVNNSIAVSFGQKTTGKEILSIGSNDCNTGCTSTVSGTQNNLTISTGQVACVAEGTTACFSSLKVNSGGTLRVCGTAKIQYLFYDRKLRKSELVGFQQPDHQPEREPPQLGNGQFDGQVHQ